MPFTLTELRGDLNALLATAPDGATWTQPMLDQGVRYALQWYGARGPVYETSLTVITPGAEQDLGALADLLTVESVVWPWFEGQRWEVRTLRWRLVGLTLVRFDSAQPAAGEIIRVRYRKTQRVNGLDGATSTTVADSHRPLLALAAAAHVLLLRLRQVSENPALPPAAAPHLRTLHDQYQEEATNLLESLCAGDRHPVWGQVGL